MRCTLLLMFAMAMAGCQSAAPLQEVNRVAGSAAARLEQLAASTREGWLDLFPVQETLSVGHGPRQAQLALTFSAEHRERQRVHHERVLAGLQRIALDELTASQRLSYRLLHREATLALEGLTFPMHLHWVFIQLDGGTAFDLIKLAGAQPLRNEADYRAWFQRLGQYPAFFDGVGDTLRQGLAAGMTVPRPVVERALAQLDQVAGQASDPATSALWKPVVGRMPASIDAPTRSALEADYRAVLQQQVLPAAQRLARYVRTEYLPQARTSAGMGALPRGDELYAHLIRRQTTLALSPDEIHHLGLAETRRVQGLLRAALLRMGYDGPLKDMGAWIRQQRAYYPFKTGQDVIDHLNTLHARIVPQLPQLFNRLPKARFEIRLTDPALAASAPAQWYPPSDDGLRPGIFAIPVVNPANRSTVGLASLLAHEGMPGHHLEGSIKREVGLPEFRRGLWITAFGEGWGLYAEHLGHELGLYDDPASLVGRYFDELYRAGRLVVDTGLHAKGWSRAQAMGYMVEQLAFAPASAEREVDRYMAWPAQALGYKLGELTLLDIRRDAERRLGPRFDIRRFHDALLEEGHLPMDLLREHMERWIRAEGG